MDLDWEDDSEPPEISFDAEQNGKNVTKKVDKLYAKLEKISQKVTEKYERNPNAKDMGVQEALRAEGWPGEQEDHLTQLAEFMVFEGTYADSFTTLSSIHNLLEEYTLTDFGDSDLFVTD